MASVGFITRCAVMQQVRELVRTQRTLERTAASAIAKCLHSVFGVELQPGIAQAAWGGVGAATAARGRMDAATALVVFAHVRDEVCDALAGGDGSAIKLQRHQPLLQQLLQAFPRPPAAVRASRVYNWQCYAWCLRCAAPCLMLQSHARIVHSRPRCTVTPASGGSQRR